jgi:hypothetical protein
MIRSNCCASPNYTPLQIPVNRLCDQDADRRARRSALRDRLHTARVMLGAVASPDELETPLYQTLMATRLVPRGHRRVWWGGVFCGGWREPR